jgi:hypothetical protein
MRESEMTERDHKLEANTALDKITQALSDKGFLHDEPGVAEAVSRLRDTVHHGPYRESERERDLDMIQEKLIQSGVDPEEMDFPAVRFAIEGRHIEHTES